MARLQVATVVLALCALVLQQVACQSTRVQSQTVCERFQYGTAPANTTCGVVGTLTKPKQILSTFKIPTANPQIVCSNACREWVGPPLCSSFSIANGNQCQLYVQSLAAQGFKKFNQGAQAYYEQACFVDQCRTRTLTPLTAGDQFQDDQYYTINLPFTYVFYGVQYTTVHISVNGFMSFGNDFPPSSSYYNQPLPTYNSGTSSGNAFLPPSTLAVYWDDLCKPIWGNQLSGALWRPEVSYTYSFGQPNYQSITVTWRLERRTVPDSYVIVHASFGTGLQGFIDVYYDQVDASGGSTATIGMQSSAAGKFVQVSYNTASIKSGTTFQFDTFGNRFATNTYTPPYTNYIKAAY